MKSKLIFVRCLLAGLALSLAGCAGFLDPGPPIAEVILPVHIEVAATADRMPARVLVVAPTADGITGTDRITALINGYELRAFDQAKWASTVPSMVQRLLVDALEASRRLESVSRDEGTFAATVRLQTDVRRFFLRYDAAGSPPVADIALTMTLIDPDSGHPFARNIFSREEACGANSLPEFINAYSRGMSAILRESGDWVLRKVSNHLAGKADE